MTDKQLDGLNELYELDDRIEQLCSQYQDNNAEISTLEAWFVLGCKQIGLNCIEVSHQANQRRQMEQAMRAVEFVSQIKYPHPATYQLRQQRRK